MKQQQAEVHNAARSEDALVKLVCINTTYVQKTGIFIF